MRLVDRVLLADLHRGEDLVRIEIDERDIVADVDAIRARPIGRERDRNRPEEPARSAVVAAYASQSACDMKPVSGVKPPMPSMMMSPFSREVTRSFGSLRARASSAARASPAAISGLSAPPPCGVTRSDKVFWYRWHLCCLSYWC